MANITIRQLQIFSAVCREGGFSRAAEQLHLTQPAVSMQVKQLERQLEIPLYEQTGRQFSLTEAGREVFNAARAISNQLEELDTIIRQLKGLERGHLRLSVVSSTKFIVPRLLGIFHRRYPEVTIRLDVGNRETLIQQLSDNAVDLIVMGRPPDEIEVEAGVFAGNPLVIIAPPDHPLAQAEGVALSQLANEIFLVREPGSGTRSAMERFFREQGVEVRLGMEVGSNVAITQSVQAGLGLGLISLHTVENELRLGQLVILDVIGFPIMRNWYVVHRAGKRLSAVAESFRSFLLEEAGSLLDSPVADLALVTGGSNGSH